MSGYADYSTDPHEWLRQAVASLLDVVQELAEGLAHGQTPEPDWSAIVRDTFEAHRKAAL